MTIRAKRSAKVHPDRSLDRQRPRAAELGFPRFLPRMDPFIHPKAAEPTDSSSSHNRPGSEAITFNP